MIRTFGRMLRRYALAVAAGVLALMIAMLAAFGGIVAYYADKYQENVRYSAEQIARALVRDEDGYHLDGENTQEEWLYGYEWAMLLDEQGNVVWRYDLPPQLDRTYTVTDVASFTRWYLDDYPVFCWITENGLLVLGRTPGTMFRYSFYSYTELFRGIYRGIVPTLLAVVALIVAGCMVFSWRGAKALTSVANGLDTLAAGGAVQLPATGFTAEVARKLNQTSALLQRQNTIIARRDAARTDWIAGVSHDIRTPLSLIFGYAEQLEHDPAVPAAQQAKAGAIRVQGQTIRRLIEDLNLTSKLQYNAQPLRLKTVRAGELLRRAVTDFCNSGYGEACSLDFDLAPDAEALTLRADEGLLGRAFSNLLGNSARHNPGCEIAVHARREASELVVTVTDNGSGYPPAVLSVLEGNPQPDPAPHVLGLHIVVQIIQAHGGRVEFGNNEPYGARTVIRLPLEAEES